MKRVISTKVDQATYAELLRYCAEVNKYPANVLREALELHLSSNRKEDISEQRTADVKEKLREPSEPKLNPKETQEQKPVKDTKEKEKPKTDVDEDEAELE
jgi:hypothetical protein